MALSADYILDARNNWDAGLGKGEVDKRAHNSAAIAAVLRDEQMGDDKSIQDSSGTEYQYTPLRLSAIPHIMVPAVQRMLKEGKSKAEINAALMHYKRQISKVHPVDRPRNIYDRDTRRGVFY